MTVYDQSAATSSPLTGSEGGEGQSQWKVKVEGLSKRFVTRRITVSALESIDLQIPQGEFYSLVGPSGCGKTTLLRIIGGLETQTEGVVSIYREGVASVYRENGGTKYARTSNRPVTAMVFQEQSVFPWMTVRDNIAFGLKARGVSRALRHQIAETYLQKIGLAGFEKALPHQLSGGMKQRVSVARAFANDPEMFLMDEPFGALDEQNKIFLQAELLKIWEETHKTVLFVTHSIDEAIVLSDKIVVMSARPGRIKEIIPVNFPRPRRIEVVRADPAFGELFARVWSLLRNEIVDQPEQSKGV